MVMVLQEDAKPAQADTATASASNDEPNAGEEKPSATEPKTDAKEEEAKPTEDEAAGKEDKPTEGGNKGAGKGPRTPRESNEVKNSRVYVGNLSWGVSWQDLKDHMKSTGLNALRANIITGPDGRSKGCGIVEFATPEEAQQAVLTLNDTELSGRQIFVREDREDKTPVAASFSPQNRAAPGSRFSTGTQSQNKRVYVGNLSWDVRWQDLKDHMRQAGEVAHAEIICEPSGRSKGCGVVEFSTEEAAQEAISTLTDTDLKGRMIFVREDRESNSTTVNAHPAGSLHSGRSGNDNCAVYVWNMSFETSWQDLKDHMRKAGNVNQANIVEDQNGTSTGCAVVVYQKPQEAARAIRELQNSELDGRNICIREDNHRGRNHGGRFNTVFGQGREKPRTDRPYRQKDSNRAQDRAFTRRDFGTAQHRDEPGNKGAESQGSGGGNQLFVTNLSYETSWQDLKDHFRQCGDVERAEVMTNELGRSKGFGTVRFFKETDAEAAIKRLNGEELQGRTLEVRFDQKARP